ncbi:hypothetical protein AOXY_G14611 [Acipenser oxyrinchus oxyrinchus]|uniref:Uncharacterized protein n=1 Tax=Acipenser oxyrinchus oxyrinchus TaxID=40147 RepID=A0AAD8G456_ACIOX|nr:hypothetical protein AOXY_G14611 [Acipenser oxyrinchus oxyrinchus]
MPPGPSTRQGNAINIFNMSEKRPSMMLYYKIAALCLQNNPWLQHTYLKHKAKSKAKEFQKQNCLNDPQH